MRISDWSSVVCSSDLVEPVVVEIEPAGRQLGRRGGFDGPAGRRDAGKGDAVHGLGPRGNEGGCGDAGEGQLSHARPACAKRSRAPPGSAAARTRSAPAHRARRSTATKGNGGRPNGKKPP